MRGLGVWNGLIGTASHRTSLEMPRWRESEIDLSPAQKYRSGSGRRNATCRSSIHRWLNGPDGCPPAENE